ncbi:protein NDNF-like [Bombina bombina]|uniref:protein NDNF-like n=1 Tax=Bombina bombina TaxID=8345 RepID=UPI00235AE11A|nr:protein NDNF-like [Bombina bombina]
MSWKYKAFTLKDAKLSGLGLYTYLIVLLVKCACIKRNLYNNYPIVLLPDGRETTIHVLKDITKRYYFTLRENSPHFSIAVTPCDVPIEWNILHYKTALGSLGKIPDDFGPVDDLKTQSQYKDVTTLFHYKGNSVETYVGTFSNPSFFMLEFLSSERDTHITVYLTTDLMHGNRFPELPFDPRIEVTAVSHNSASLVWKSSPSALKSRENIEYCLLVNEKHNYKSLCAADTAVRSAGGKWGQQSTFPISSYSQETQSVMVLSNREFSIVHKTNNADVRQICIGNRNTYTVFNLSSNTQYYFDVFVVNLNTNASAAYTGSFAKTLAEPKPKLIQMKDGKIVRLSFDGIRQKSYSLEYQGMHKKVQFTFQTCRGQIRAQILKNGKILVSETIENLRHIILKGKVMDKYVVVLKSAQRYPSSIMVQASSYIHKSLFPLFPDNLKIKSFNKLRTCDSITIAWLGTQERSMYCVYKKKIEEDQIWSDMSNVDKCLGPESRPKSEKVSCKYFHDVNLQKAVATETINGLEKGVSYMLDVYLMGSSGTLLRYQGKVVKTRKKC